MIARTREHLDQLLAASSAEMLATHGVPIEKRLSGPAEVDAAEVSSGGLIKFAGDSVSGSILLVASFEFLSLFRPARLRGKTLTMSSSTDWLVVRDWSMELANQLLGKVRNRLYERGIVVEARCPIAVSGHPLAVSIKSRASQPLQILTQTKHVVRVWLDATPSASFDAAIDKKPDPPETTPKEGDIIPF